LALAQEKDSRPFKRGSAPFFHRSSHLVSRSADSSRQLAAISFQFDPGAKGIIASAAN